MCDCSIGLLCPPQRLHTQLCGRAGTHLACWRKGVQEASCCARPPCSDAHSIIHSHTDRCLSAALLLCNRRYSSHTRTYCQHFRCWRNVTPDTTAQDLATLNPCINTRVSWQTVACKDHMCDLTHSVHRPVQHCRCSAASYCSCLPTGGML